MTQSVSQSSYSLHKLHLWSEHLSMVWGLTEALFISLILCLLLLWMLLMENQLHLLFILSDDSKYSQNISAWKHTGLCISFAGFLEILLNFEPHLETWLFTGSVSVDVLNNTTTLLPSEVVGQHVVWMSLFGAYLPVKYTQGKKLNTNSPLTKMCLIFPQTSDLIYTVITLQFPQDTFYWNYHWI